MKTGSEKKLIKSKISTAMNKKNYIGTEQHRTELKIWREWTVHSLCSPTGSDKALVKKVKSYRGTLQCKMCKKRKGQGREHSITF